jgi:hypothetical protein
MSHTPENSALRIDADLQKALETASFEEMKEALHTASTRQGLTVPDRFSPDILIPTELADAAPKTFAQRVTLDGKPYFIEGDSPEDLKQKVADFVRAQTQPATQQQQQPRDEQGRFASAEQHPVAVDAAKKAELLLQFQLGQIDAATYMEQSGEIADYLAKQGVPLEEVKQIVEEKKDARFEQSWSDAVSEFLQSPAGRSWPGGQRNLEIAQALLAANGLAEAADKVDALHAVFEHMKANDLLAENPEVVARQQIGQATSFEAVVEAARRSVGR